MDSELARAYNKLADPHKPTCKEMLKKALALLKPHEEYFEDDYYWNFRMGYLLQIRLPIWNWLTNSKRQNVLSVTLPSTTRCTD